MSTVSVSDQLKVLVELQKLDGQIYRLKRELSAKPQEGARLKAEAQQALEALKKMEEQYKALEVKRNQMEIDLGEKENQIKKFQGQLFQVKTNKEYTALQKEIEGLNADKSVLEEEILKFMDQTDQVRSRLLVEREALKAQEADLKTALDRIDAQSREIQAAIQQHQAGRQVLTPKVDPTILTRYERILVNKEGTALVPVRGMACGGCNMVLPHQMINEIQMASRLILCESCARILYLEPSE